MLLNKYNATKEEIEKFENSLTKEFIDGLNKGYHNRPDVYLGETVTNALHAFGLQARQLENNSDELDEFQDRYTNEILDAVEIAVKMQEALNV